MTQQIIIKKISLPALGSINNDIDFICKSFGYFSERDKQETAGKIFRILVKEAAGEAQGLTSDEIAEKLNLTRGTIVYHLNSFIAAGLVIKERNTYRLRAPSLQKCIEEIKEDIDRIMKQMMKIATDIDEKLGRYYR
ncbi:MAG TPA: MarR family transcriptional regulator [Thermoplasmatales archaeon]|nr:MarR family transcriptional regulator [Thermoplasmatales archaeon]